MSWETLVPTLTRKLRVPVTAAARMLKDGTITVTFNFSAALQDELKAPKKVAVQVGRDNDAGRIRFVFGPSGDYGIAPATPKGGMRLTLGPFAGGATRKAAAASCRIVTLDKAGQVLVVELPEGWSKKGADEPARAATAPFIETKGFNPTRPLDAVAYLTGKGHKISRLAQGRFALDGETVTKGWVLKLVNDSRKSADLDPLVAEAIE